MIANFNALRTAPSFSANLVIFLCSQPRSASSAIILRTVSETLMLFLSWYPSMVSMISLLLVLVNVKESCRTSSPSVIPYSILPLFRIILSCYIAWFVRLGCGMDWVSVVSIEVFSYLFLTYRKTTEKSAWERWYLLPACWTVR